MKKKLSLLLCTIAMLVCSLFGVVLTTAKADNTATTLPTTATQEAHACEASNTEVPGIFLLENITTEDVTNNIAYNAIGLTLDSTNHVYLNYKFKAKNVDSIRFTYKAPSNTTELYTLTVSSLTADVDGAYVVRYAIPSDSGIYAGTLQTLRIKVGVSNASDNYVEFAGIAFDADGTYDNWATFTKTDSGETGGGTVIPTAAQIGDTWTKTGENVTLETTPDGSMVKASLVAEDTTDVGNVTDAAAANYISVPTTDYTSTANNGYVSIKYKANGVSGMGLHLSSAGAIHFVGNLLDGWNCENVSYDALGYSIVTAQIAGYLADFTANVDALVVRFVGEAGATLEIIDIAITEDGNHGMVKEFFITDITPASGMTHTKNNDGSQTLSYSASAGWNTSKITVNNYDVAEGKTELTMVINASETFYMAVKVGNEYDGHNAYAGGKDITVRINFADPDVYGIDLLSENFTIELYIDSEQTVTAEKTITFKSITLETPYIEPVRTDVHFAAPVSTAMACVEGTMEGSYDVSYTDTESGSWRNISFAINNYTTEYDAIVLDIVGVQGMNLGIRVYYNIQDGADVLETHATVRNHFTEEGIFQENGAQTLVFFMKAFELQNKQLTKVELWFDPPTDTYDRVLGDRSTTINSIRILKSSELNLGTVTITAPAMTVSYTGEAISFVAVSAENVALKISYKNPADEKPEWSTAAPSAVGVYEVKVEFMGSLAYDYACVTSSLTINKIKATLPENAISIDPTTRVITVAEGVVVSTDEEFTEGYEVANGDVIAYGQKLYYYMPETDNFFASDVAEFTFTRPDDGDSSNDNNSSTPNQSTDSTSEEEDGGCFSSITGLNIAAFVGVLGVAAYVSKKRKE